MRVDIDSAVELLMQEQVVAVPTETVYGLAARYDANSAIYHIFELKNRPLDHPVIVHIGDIAWLERLTKDRPTYVKRLIEAFWPGPLTIVLAKTPEVSSLITAGQPTVAVRMPNHPICLRLIKALNKPIVAPSANPYCRVSPTNAKHVIKYFSNQVPVVDGGDCELGIESTIVLATEQKSIQILRPGLITQNDIQKVIGVPCIRPDAKIKVSGNKQRHYSPSVPLIAFSDPSEVEAYINDNRHRYFFILYSQINTGKHDKYNLKANPQYTAAILYKLWHEAEEKQYDAIVIEKPNDSGIWRGILDRLNKAAAQSVRDEGNVSE